MKPIEDIRNETKKLSSTLNGVKKAFENFENEITRYDTNIVFERLKEFDYNGDLKEDRRPGVIKANDIILEKNQKKYKEV